ncbi:MAG: flagellar biosynthesis chaperone FliJ [Saprospiraceae bacterium]|jgi:flagellar biosynthesis chaperone FliJ
MFDKLKSIFIVEDENSKKQAANPEEKLSTPKTRSEEHEGSVPERKITPSSGNISTKFTEVLFNAMEANDLDGFDYLEYKQSLKSLEKMPMDEQTRFKSAFAMAQTMGATPDHLIKTANHYIRVLLKEEEKFGNALANQRTRQIGDKENQIKQLDSVIKEKTQRIAQMKTEIEKHTKDMQAMKADISSAAVKVESTKNDFRASFNNLVGQINKDIENMKNYLK